MIHIRKEWLIGSACILMLVAVFFLGRSCGPDAVVVEKPDTTVDTSKPDEATAEAIKEAEKQSEKMIDTLEKEHAKDIETFTDDQKEEYEVIRKDGPNAVADWLTSFNREM